jgi:hypothetical protein
MSCKHDGSDYCLKGFLKRNAGPDCRYYERLTLYLCGPITSDDQYQAKFLNAEQELYEAGFYPVNPTACIQAGTDWNQAMKQAIPLMLQCSGVALLDRWEESKGAQIEARLAGELGIPVKLIREWEKPKPV